LFGSAGYLSKPSLLFGHGAAVACYHAGTGWVCNDPLELSASVHDVKIAVLGAVHTRPRHRPVAVRIHGIGAIRMDLHICSSSSYDQILVKGAGRGRERDETDLTDRAEVNDAIAEGPAVGELNVVSRHVIDAK
jgi:hypothetical protein